MGWFGKLVAGIVVVVLAFFVVTRFTDGPMGIITGGAFSSGEVVSSNPDWRYVKDYDIVEFQLLDPARSRTTWIVEHDGRIFIPSGYMLSTVGKIWKQWPLQAEKDGRAILRVDAKLYPRQLVRIKDDPVLPAVLAELSRKYANGAQIPVSEVSRGSLWIFELVQR
jgi:hypothetical protein